ncbi:MAG: hypothetical protein LH472_14670 [Pyrinomonadaceae bacterium]|nr:hypothetical protein [Pyrinomonadaceae bacterium]
MNCREFTIEFEERGSLSEPATRHLTICADCKKISDRQMQIWLMIDGLKPVAAPNDFDIRVKARIANAKPSDFQSPRFLPILRYVLPLSVVVLLFGLFVFNSAYFSGSQNVPQIAQSIIENPTAKENPPVNIAFANQLAFAPSNGNKSAVEPSLTAGNSIVEIPSKTAKRLENNQDVKFETAALSSNRQAKSPRKSGGNDSGGGSRVSALSETTIRTPKGINLNANVNGAPKIESPKPAGDAEILSFFGIETVLENGRRTVKSLTKNSAAGRSDVKVGDVIEKVKNNSVMILRGTEKLEITFQSSVNQQR